MIARTRETGFALPTILIVSVVMVIIMLAAVQSIVNINIAINNDYYTQLANSTAESGMLKAKQCITLNGSVGWSNANKLRPNTDCNGGPECTTAQKTNATTGWKCYVLSKPNIKTTFTVGEPTLLSDGSRSVLVESEVQLVRTSDPTTITPWRTYTGDARLIVPAPSTTSIDITKVDPGQNAICGVSASSSLYCLGSNDNYRLGTGDGILTGFYTFKKLEGDLAGKAVSKLSVNGMHGCAISDGSIYCWGSQQNGALGINTTGHRPSPAAVYTGGALAGKTMTSVTAAGTGGALAILTIYAHTCALDSDGNAYCWGANGAPLVSGVLGGGQLGNGTVGGGDSYAPAPVVGGLQFKEDQIVGGSWHTCAIRRVDNPFLTGDGWLYCWGSDNNGQVGNDTGFSPNGTPARVVGKKANLLDFEYQNAKFRQISAGQAHNCAVTTTNTMWCWGQNAQGQLGVGNTGDGSVAQKVPLPSGETGWKKVTAGTYWTCALTVAGRAYCWGGASILGPVQYLGDGNNSWSSRPSPVPVVRTGVLSGKTLEDIWTTWTTTIARDTEGNYYSWGINNAGTLGTGLNTTPDTNVPIMATHLNNFNITSGSSGAAIPF